MRLSSRGDAKCTIGVIRAADAKAPDPEVTHSKAPLRMVIELASPVQDKLRGFILDNRKTEPLKVIEPNVRLGKTLAICGAGPSLRSAVIEGVDEVWACNSALPYLVDAGVKVTAGIGIDQTLGLVSEWASPPDVPYYVATSCDPALIAHLQAHDRAVTFFHNYVGCDENEFQFYVDTWPGTIMVGEGASVVSRTIGVAQFMGFERVDIYGADCCFAEGDVTHANGETATRAYGAPVILTGETNGRTYRARPDMLMDAVHLVRRVRKTAGRVRLMGDTFPVALLGKSEEYLDELCRRIAPGDALPDLNKPIVVPPPISMAVSVPAA